MLDQPGVRGVAVLAAIIDDERPVVFQPATDGRQIRFLFLPEGEDPDTLVRKEGKEAFERRVVEKALPLSSYLLESVAQKIPPTGHEGRAGYISEVLNHAARLPSGNYKDLILGELTRIDPINAGKLTMLNQTPGAREAGTPKAPGRLQLNSPVRKAIGYLLHRPALAMSINDPGSVSGDAGLDVLGKLLEFARRNPHINGAAALEHWRGTETGAFLDRLAQAEIVTPDEALESEFQALMADLTGRRLAELRRDELISESRKRALNSAEKAELTRLLAEPARKQGTDSAKSS